jgi:hypothetical protein
VLLNFVASVASTLTEFMKMFQTDAPMIHLLFDKLGELVRLVMLKFLKITAIGEKYGCELAQLDCNYTASWLPVSEVDIGVGARTALAAISDDAMKKKLRYAFRQCFLKITTYMQTTLPLTNPVLRDPSCLQP